MNFLFYFYFYFYIFHFIVDVAVHMAIYINENNILFLLVRHVNIFHLSLNGRDHFNTRPKVRDQTDITEKLGTKLRFDIKDIN